MAGYMSKLIHYQFDGESFVATTPAQNGMFGQITMTGSPAVKTFTPGANNSLKVMVLEVGDIYDGTPAIRCVVTAEGHTATALNAFVESEIEVDNTTTYNTEDYAVPVGKQVKVHVLQVGDEFWTTMYKGTPAAGNTFIADSTNVGYIKVSG